VQCCRCHAFIGKRRNYGKRDARAIPGLFRGETVVDLCGRWRTGEERTIKLCKGEVEIRQVGKSGGFDCVNEQYCHSASLAMEQHTISRDPCLDALRRQPLAMANIRYTLCRSVSIYSWSDHIGYSLPTKLCGTAVTARGHWFEV
jgi:hypothetical protein